MVSWSQKLTQTYYQCLESIIIAHFNRSFLLTLALKTRTCVMALLIPTWSKLSHDMMEILVSYRLPMGSRWGRGAFTIMHMIVPLIHPTQNLDPLYSNYSIWYVMTLNYQMIVGEVPKAQWSSWQFDSWLWSLLTTPNMIFSVRYTKFKYIH